MKRLVRAMIQSDSGASIVEFAILAPVFILLLMGVIEIGRYAHYAILASNAARAGVEYGAQSLVTANDLVGMQNAAMADAQDTSSGSPTPMFSAAPSLFCKLNGTVTTCPAPGSAPVPNLVYYVEVDTSGTIHSLMTYPGVPSSIRVSGKSVMQVINQ